MKKVIIAILSLIFLVGCADDTQDNNNTNSATPQRIATNTIPQNTTVPEVVNITVFDNKIDSNQIAQTNDINTVQETEPKEEEISSFTTELLTDDSKRENNIDITCSKINNYVVKQGDIFSFTDTVGKATSAKGYEEADIFDGNGHKTKGLGGGNCQVSSTLYNAVLEASGSFEIVERHPHSSKVYYVPDGKDAAVAYGSLDFKFKNNNNFDVKIYASSTETDVTVRLVKVSY